MLAAIFLKITRTLPGLPLAWSGTALASEIALMRSCSIVRTPGFLRKKKGGGGGG